MQYNLQLISFGLIENVQSGIMATVHVDFLAARYGHAKQHAVNNSVNFVSYLR